MAKRGRPPYKVFLSYSHADRWIAQQFVRIIESASGNRIQVFIDKRDLAAGDRIDEAIREAIRGCNEFLVLLTRNSKDREWVRAEIAIAFAFSKRIVSVVDKVLPKEMPQIAFPYSAVDLNDFEDYVSQLLKRASARMERR